MTYEQRHGDEIERLHHEKDALRAEVEKEKSINAHNQKTWGEWWADRAREKKELEGERDAAVLQNRVLLDFVERINLNHRDSHSMREKCWICLDVEATRKELTPAQKPNDASSDERCVVCEFAKPLKVSLLCSGCYEIMVAGAKKRKCAACGRGPIQVDAAQLCGDCVREIDGGH